MSIKECFHVRGCDSTAGLTQYLFKPSSEDGLTVKLLRKNGAIPFCMTNVPQTMMGYQCSNPCFGATGNMFFVYIYLSDLSLNAMALLQETFFKESCFLNLKVIHTILVTKLEDHLAEKGH